MAKCGITNISGGGGIGSDELSVTADKVVEGNTYVGADTNDEIGTGTLVDRPFVVSALSTAWDNTGGLYNRIPTGAYRTPSSTGYPEIQAAPNDVRNAGGLSADKLMVGKSAFGLPGTATSDANAVATDIRAGKSAYVNGVKLPGALSPNSIMSFSAAAYSTTQILLQWQNPYAATGRPFSGVFINYSTSGYPGTGGTRIYKGYGSNSTPGGISQVIVTMPAVGTTYYFSAINYASATPVDLLGTTLNAVAATTARGQQTFTSSGAFTIPNGVRNIDIFCVGGGAGGGLGSSGTNGTNAGGGGGSGYTITQKNIAVTPGTQLSIIVGSGGGMQTNGGDSSIVGIGSAGGGKFGKPGYDSIVGNNGSGGAGGSGGGGGSWFSKNVGNSPGGNGGSDGTNGESPGGSGGSGVGQKTTTRAFGESSGTLYAGGGGGGGNAQYTNTARGLGGAGGGGNGGDAMGTAGSAGTAGTGGGGGGGYGYTGSSGGNGYSGGSGIVLIRWGYQ